MYNARSFFVPVCRIFHRLIFKYFTQEDICQTSSLEVTRYISADETRCQKSLGRFIIALTLCVLTYLYKISAIYYIFVVYLVPDYIMMENVYKIFPFFCNTSIIFDFYNSLVVDYNIFKFFSPFEIYFSKEFMILKFEFQRMFSL